MMSMKKRKSVPKNAKRLTLIVTLLFLILIASISLGFVLSMNNQDEVELSISERVNVTAQYLIENRVAYDEVDIEIVQIDTLSNVWNLCFLFQGITNLSGIVSIDGRNNIYTDIIIVTPEGTIATPIPENYEQSLCHEVELSAGLHLIDMNLYETRTRYQWAIEIE